METQNNPSPRTVTRRLSQAWPPFTRKLADALAHLGEDQYLVIAAKRANRYVQFAGQGARVACRSDQQPLSGSG